MDLSSPGIDVKLKEKKIKAQEKNNQEQTFSFKSTMVNSKKKWTMMNLV